MSFGQQGGCSFSHPTGPCPPQLLSFFDIIALHYTVIVYNSGGYKKFIIASIDFYMIALLYLFVEQITTQHILII